MTYAILSLKSGNFLESYRSEDRALEAAARLCAMEPTALPTLALVTFDDEGTPVAGIDGNELVERVAEFAAEQQAATA